MCGLTSTHPREILFQHLDALRTYATRAVLQGDALTVPEEQDRAERMQEALAIGISFGLTEKEIATLLYRELFQVKRGCDCSVCKSRRSNEHFAKEPEND